MKASFVSPGSIHIYKEELRGHDIEELPSSFCPERQHWAGRFSRISQPDSPKDLFCPQAQTLHNVTVQLIDIGQLLLNKKNIQLNQNSSFQSAAPGTDGEPKEMTLVRRICIFIFRCDPSENLFPTVAALYDRFTTERLGSPHEEEDLADFHFLRSIAGHRFHQLWHQRF